MAMLANIFRSFFGEGKRDLVQVTGSFYEFSNDWRCLFNNCEATIRKGDGEYNYQLIVTRVIEEGEELEEGSPVQFTFSVEDAMNLTKEPGIISDYAFSWTDVQSGQNSKFRNRYLFEFDSERSGNIDQLSELFESTLCQCMYEQRYKTPHTEASKEDLLQFMRSESSTAPFATPAKSAAKKPLTPHQSPQSSSSPYKTPTKPTTGRASTTTTPLSSNKDTTNLSNTNANNVVPAAAYPVYHDLPAKTFKEGEDVVSVVAQLYLLETTSNQFQYQEEVRATIKATGNNKDVFTFNLLITKKNSDDLILLQPINSDMFMTYYHSEHSCVWVYTFAHQMWTWSLVFTNQDDEAAFKRNFTERLWETNSGKPFGKLKADESEWIHKGYEEDVPMEQDDGNSDYDMMEFEEANDKEEEDEEVIEDEEEEDDENELEISQEDNSDKETMSPDGSKNSLLTVGYKNDRSFVARGSKIGVFKHTPSNKLKYSTSINKLKTKEGKIFSPKKMMLHQEDTSLLLLHPEERNKIFRMDLNRPDVVEEWKSGDNYPVNEIFPQTKYAQMSNESTVLGMNNLGFMYLDPRLPKDKVVDSKSYFYKPSTRPMLQCAATTGSGQMAVGTKTGEIKLFSAKTMATPKKDFDQAPRAKTSLPGYGDPIIGIDVTEDGHWILATCKTYLLVIPTELAGTTTGFETSMGKEKPAPRRLQLRREHITQMGGKVSFTPARFNVGQDMERSIVTSTGPYIITWNFRKVKQNQLREYQIKQYHEDIVGDQFRFGDDKAIVVATPNDVSMATKVVKTFSPVNSPVK